PPLDKLNYDAKRFREAWSQLGGPAKVAYPALWQCVRMGDAILPELKKQWSIDLNPQARVRFLIGQLNDDKFAVRAEASRELELLGSLASSMIQQALLNPVTLEQQRRLEKLLSSAKDRDVRQRQRRTLMLLEQIGTKMAEKTLVDLTSGAIDAQLKDDADATL